MYKLSIFFVFLPLGLLCQVNIEDAEKVYHEGKYRQVLEMLANDQSNMANIWKARCFLKMMSHAETPYSKRDSYHNSFDEIYEKLDADNAALLKMDMESASEGLQYTGVLFYNEDKKTSAYALLAMAFSLNKQMGVNDTALAFNAGKLAMEQHDLGNAEYYLETAIEGKIKNAEAFYLLIDIFKQIDDEKKLGQVFDKAKEVHPGDAYIVNEEINFLLGAEKHEEALAVLEKVNSGHFNHELWMLQGALHENLGQIVEAESTYKKMLEKNDLDVLVLSRMGLLYLGQAIMFQNVKSMSESYLTKSKEILEKAHSIDPQYKEILLSMQQLYSLTGEKDKFSAVEKKLNQLH
jgi:tetratricopeptide (TPR) repeat protein